MRSASRLSRGIKMGAFFDGIRRSERDKNCVHCSHGPVGRLPGEHRLLACCRRQLADDSRCRARIPRNGTFDKLFGRLPKRTGWQPVLPRKLQSVLYESVNVTVDRPQDGGYNFYELASSRRESIPAEGLDRDDLKPANRD